MYMILHKYSVAGLRMADTDVRRGNLKGEGGADLLMEQPPSPRDGPLR